jgi:IS4 transposase
LRKDRGSEEAGLERLRRENQHKRGGKAVSGQQREYNKYRVVATSLGEEVSAKEVLRLYRMRWQIELAFKRLKSLFQYGQVPSKLDQSARAWFYGKLLVAALSERLVNEGRFSPHEPSESSPL